MVELEFVLVQFMIRFPRLGGAPQGAPPVEDGSYSK